MTDSKDNTPDELGEQWRELEKRFNPSKDNTPIEAIEFPFAQWASSSDWVYLPAKKLWYNEEDEENITPKTTEQLYQIFKTQNP